MNTDKLVKEVARRTGLPITKVRSAMFDFTRDCQSIVANQATSGFNIPNIGFLFFKQQDLTGMWEAAGRIERMFVRYQDRFTSGTEKQIDKYREIFTNQVDEFYEIANLLMENNYIKNGIYKKGAGRKIEFDMEDFKRLLTRVDDVMVQLPVTLKRRGYTEIQKICLRKLSEQGILCAPLEDKDCKVFPMRMPH